MNHLLSGKTALRTKSPKRPPAIIQSATRVHYMYEPKKFMSGRRHTMPNLYAHKSSNACQNIIINQKPKTPTQDGINTNTCINANKEKGTTTRVKLREKRNLQKQRKLSEPIITTSCFDEENEKANRNSGSYKIGLEVDSIPEEDLHLCRENTKDIVFENANFLDNEDDSSSSTEFCDDEQHLADNRSDFHSSLEVRNKVLDLDKNKDNNAANGSGENNKNFFDTSEMCDFLLTDDVSTELSTNYCVNPNANNGSVNNCTKSQPRNGDIYKDLRNGNSIANLSDIGVDSQISLEIKSDNNAANGDYSAVKHELSQLILDECIKRLNEKMSLNDDNQ